MMYSTILMSESNTVDFIRHAPQWSTFSSAWLATNTKIFFYSLLLVLVQPVALKVNGILVSIIHHPQVFLTYFESGVCIWMRRNSVVSLSARQRSSNTLSLCSKGGTTTMLWRMPAITLYVKLKIDNATTIATATTANNSKLKGIKLQN